MADDTEIAIVGVGCRFPGADDLQGFWRVLKNGENHIVDIPKERWDINGFYDTDPNATGRSYVKKAGFVKSLDIWDNQFFGINDIEAKFVDPQQRLVLDCVHMALENGGFTRKEIDGSLTGVYIGAMNDDFNGLNDTSVANNYTVTGTQRSIISARVSYVYNLQGPAMSIDTACSSSLVAINIGSHALKLGECNMAVCGGVNCMLDPNIFVALSKARMLSPTGQCQAFSADADGYARGEGCGIVILKRLKDALRDDNEILGTIKTSTNQDGHMTSPITAPSGQQQTALLEHIYSHYKVDKRCMQVIEAHGTGTPIGDPVEANALGGYFEGSGKNVYIGSVKTNIGHLESAAGVAGLIKILLMMKYKTIVPSLMYRPENENPKLNLTKHGLKVPTTCQPWDKRSAHYRMACVNSFGFGGTNAHAIVEEFVQEQKSDTLAADNLSLVVLSADVQGSLVDNVTALRNSLEIEDVDIVSLAFTSQFKRDHRRFRKSFTVRSQRDLISQLTKFSDSVNKARNIFPVNFVFCGVGTTWTGMGKEIMTNNVFSRTVAEIDCHLKKLAGWSVGDMFRKGYSVAKNPIIDQIAIFAYQVGLDALWKAAGIQPNAVIGQSVGEVAAAYSAGYLDLKSATEIIYYRSKYLANVATGKMVVIKNQDVAVLESFCKGKDDRLTIAVLSSNMSCTMSGDVDEIEAVCSFIKKEYKNGVIIPLNVQCAYHSKHVEGAANALKEEIDKLLLSSSNNQIPVYSTVTGRQETVDTFKSGGYWEKNVRMQVKFGEAIKQSANENEFTLFVEIGPSPVLKAHLENIFPKDTKPTLAVPSVFRNNEMETLIASLGKLYEHGIMPHWGTLFPTKAKLSVLPVYVLRDKRCPFSRTSTSTPDRVRFSKKHLFMEHTMQENGDDSFLIQISPLHTPFVFEHRVKKRVVVPGAFYADAGFFLGNNVLRIMERSADISLDFLSPMTLSENTSMTLQVNVRQIGPTELEFVVKYGSIAKCKGRVKQKQGLETLEQIVHNIDKMEANIAKTSSIVYSKQDIYTILGGFGFHYGPCFGILQGAIANNEEGLIDIEVPDGVLKEVDSTIIHPCILDSALQSCFFGFKSEGVLKDMLPASIGAIHVFKKPERIMKMHTRKTNVTSLETTFQVHFNVSAYNAESQLIFHMDNFTLYTRQAGWKVPIELQYGLSLRSIDCKPSHQKKKRTLFVLTDETNPGLIQRLHSDENVRKLEQFSEIQNALFDVDSLQDDDTIVVLFESHSISIDGDSAYIYNRIRDNCWGLTKLMRSLMKINISIPLVIATQNAQLLTTEGCDNPISIFGPEVWGFTRCVQTEFVLKDVTLVDLQPAMDTNMDTFVDYFSTVNPDPLLPKEIVIKDSDILQFDMNRLPKSTMCPKYRASSIDRTSPGTKETFVFIPDGVISTTPYLTMATPKEKTNHAGRDTTEVMVQTVFRHPPSLSVNRFKDAHDNGLHGLEYTCIKEWQKRKIGFQCSNYSVAPFDNLDDGEQIQHVVVFPAHVQPSMKVPRKCLISSREIPFYKPGLMIYALIFWEMTKHVPLRSTILIFSEDKHEFVYLLKYMLVSKRKSTISSQDSSNENNADGVIILNRKNNVLKNIWQGKLVISLPDTLTLSQISIVKDCGSSYIEIGSDNVLENGILPRHIKDVTRWMMKNKEVLSSHSIQQTEAPVQIEIARGHKLLLDSKRNHDDLFDKTAAYIITGGLTGLGWELVQLLIEMGATKICTIGRRNPNPEQNEAIDALSKMHCCEIFHFQADVSDLNSIQNALRQIEGKLGNVKGIFHCAGVLDSHIVTRLDLAAIENVLKPKVLGALNLHYATQNMNIDYFVMTSSITSLIGTPGQSNYGAANNFLDAFAIFLRQKGFAGQSIRWGALDLGMVKDYNLEENMRRRGHRLMSVPEIRSCFRCIVMTNSSGVVCADLDWDTIAFEHNNNQMQTVVHKIRNCIEENVTKSTDEIITTAEDLTFDIHLLQTAGPDEQVSAVETFVEQVALRIVRDDLGDFTLSSKLIDVGFDSMSAITFTNIVYDYTKCRLPFELFNENEATFMTLAENLLSQLFAVKNDNETLADVSRL